MHVFIGSRRGHVIPGQPLNRPIPSNGFKFQHITEQLTKDLLYL